MNEAAAPAALSVRGLTKTYGAGLTAVRDLDLEVADGSFFGLLGPNGAGKTTLIGAVCNLVRPTAGEIRDPRPRSPLARGTYPSSALRSRTSTSTASSTPRRSSSTRPATTGSAGARHGAARAELLDLFDLSGQGKEPALGALRRDAAPAPARTGARAWAAAPDPRRAHGRRRRGASGRALGLHPPAARPWHDRAADDALPGGGRGALRRDCADPRRRCRRPGKRRRPARPLRRARHRARSTCGRWQHDRSRTTPLRPPIQGRAACVSLAARARDRPLPEDLALLDSRPDPGRAALRRRVRGRAERPRRGDPRNPVRPVHPAGAPRPGDHHRSASSTGRRACSRRATTATSTACLASPLRWSQGDQSPGS